ncbi:hypothetical protein GGR56DRAFT_682495 [Xylariaceae sp. FL0804]|nr:hypothetical protein GGR56DRAFT_682495 [Xylariaceae sp. FL0804]
MTDNAASPARPDPSNESNKTKRPKPRRRTKALTQQRRRKSGKVEEWYLIKDIIDEKLEDGHIHYLIDWLPRKDGQPYDPTWEPESNVNREAIDAWREKKIAVASAQENSRDSGPVHAPGGKRSRLPAEDSDIDQPGQDPEARALKRRRLDEDPENPLPETQSGLAPVPGPQIVIELQRGETFDAAAYETISSTQGSSQLSSQVISRPVGARVLDSRIIPDSQEVSGFSESETQRSLPEPARAFPAPQTLGGSTTAHAATGEPHLQDSAQSSSEIPSHQPEPRYQAQPRNQESRATAPESQIASAASSGQHHSTTTETQADSDTGRPVAFLTQIPFDSESAGATSQPVPTSSDDIIAASSQHLQDALASQQATSSTQSDIPKGVSQPSTISTPSQPGYTLQAAQVILPLTSQPQKFSTQAHSDFSVFDEESIVPDTVSRNPQAQPESQDSSQALSELDANTKTSSNSARDLVIGAEPAPVPDHQSPTSPSKQLKSTGPKDLIPIESSQPSSTAPLKRLQTPPLAMEGSSASNPPMSAKERLKRIREAAFARPPVEPVAAESSDEMDTQLGEPRADGLQLEVRDGIDTTTTAEVAAPLASPSLVVPVVPSLGMSLGEESIAGHSPGPEASLALEESGQPSALVIEEVVPVRNHLDASLGEQPATLDPSALTLSIEQDMDISPSVPTDDGPIASLPSKPTPEAKEHQVQSGYPRLLLPSVPTGPNEYLITLPFYNSNKVSYNDILREHNDLLNEYNASFLVTPHQTPDSTTVAKLDAMFSRLFDICDFPPFLDTAMSMSPDILTKHVVGTNPKFGFVAELLDNLSELRSEKKILILVRPGRLMQLLGNLMRTRGYHYIQSGQEISEASPDKYALTVAVSSTTDEPSSIPKNYDAVIAFDHTYRQELVPVTDDMAPHLTLALVTTASIQHLNMRIHESLEPLERKNVLMLALVNAMSYVEKNIDPTKLFEVAEMFANCIHTPELSDDFYWEPQPLPEKIFEDLYAASSQFSQLTASAFGPSQLPASRKRSHDDEDDEEVIAKRTRMSQPLVFTDASHISDSLKSLIGDDFTQDAEKTTLTVPVDKMEALSARLAKVDAALEASKERQDHLRKLSDRSKKEVDSYVATVNRMQAVYMAALKDRSIYEAESKSAQAEAASLTAALASTKKENATLKEEKIESERRRAEAVQSILDSEKPEAIRMVQMEAELSKAIAQVQQMEKKVALTQKDMDYTKDAYQKASQSATELLTENQNQRQEIEALRRKAADNVVQVNRIQAASEARELERQLREQKGIAREREAELARAREELRGLRSGRRETRQSSVPRSPRLSALGSMMSPRNGGGIGGGGGGYGSARGPSAMSGGAGSRGTSPAAPPPTTTTMMGGGGLDGSGGGGGGAAGNSSPNAPFLQTPGNARYAHLRG